jgi:hypothetical protein
MAQSVRLILRSTIDRDNSLTPEGNTESELRNFLLVANQRRTRAILITLYRKQCDQ